MHPIFERAANSYIKVSPPDPKPFWEKYIEHPLDALMSRCCWLYRLEPSLQGTQCSFAKKGVRSFGRMIHWVLNGVQWTAITSVAFWEVYQQLRASKFRDKFNVQLMF